MEVCFGLRRAMRTREMNCADITVTTSHRIRQHHAQDNLPGSIQEFSRLS